MPEIVKRPKAWSVSSGKVERGQKVVIYGAGGMGKTTLAASIQKYLPKGKELVYFDLEGGSSELDINKRVCDISTWEEFEESLKDTDLVGNAGAIVVDTFSRLQGFFVDRILKGDPDATALADIPFGKGPSRLYQSVFRAIATFDALAKRGIHIVFICHDVWSETVNSVGQDYVEVQPRLSTDKKGDNSVRHFIKEWCDHLVYIKDVAMTNQEGKLTGLSKRKIFCANTPGVWSKSRRLPQILDFKDRDDTTFWAVMFGKGGVE